MVSSNRGTDHQVFLQIKEEEKFFSRLSSKKSRSNSQFEASSRVLYYGGAPGSVPFLWESSPGTPKYPSSHSSLPPLTPPPSYQSTYPKTNSKQKYSKPNFNLFTFLIPRISCTKNHVEPALSSSSISSSSCSSFISYSSSADPTKPRSSSPGGCCLSRSRSNVRSFSEDEYEQADEDVDDRQSPTSIFCFGSAKGFPRDSRG